MKNSKGEEYRLRRPNPLVKNQRIWDPNELIFYNFENIYEEHKEVVVRSNPLEKEKSVKTKLVPQLTNDEFLNGSSKREDNLIVDHNSSSQEDNIPKEPELSEKKVEVPEPAVKVVRQPRDDEVTCWCLPAKYRIVKDDFGADSKELFYGDKFLFTAIIASMDDLSFKFWTKDPDGKILNQSIIFPYKFANGKPVGQYRWWKVIRVEEFKGGFMYTATISTYNPSFG